MLRSLLKNEGYEVIEAEDGKSGVELAKKEDPDVILMDLTMPLMDGLKACRLLKEDEKTKNIPIISHLCVLGAFAVISDSGFSQPIRCVLVCDIPSRFPDHHGIHPALLSFPRRVAQSAAVFAVV